MTQANNVLETLVQPEADFDFLIEEEVEQEEFLEVSAEEDDEKPGKGRSTRRRTQTKKKHYTEDSIR
ncbi:MAG TPA: RNA polymerase sigma factor, RpoD/SigA family, partial [Cyanobacteria bacterium UBA11369]|nr:RNA polymerase sigma factor, RpoD/SigA family [Cyanobacteria bacterium UBA11369]